MPVLSLRRQLQIGQASSKTGNARNANRNGDNLNVNDNNSPDNHNPNRGWRASLRVYSLCVSKSISRISSTRQAFFQPPPSLPVFGILLSH